MSPLSASAEERTEVPLSLGDAFRRLREGGTFRDLSGVVLMAANILPVFGVLFWDWDLLTLLLLYWMETAVIGFWHFLRMGLVAKWFSLFLIPFFTMHFGMFMWGHLTFIVLLFGRGVLDPTRGGAEPNLILFLVNRGLWLPFLALFVSHGVSFYQNFWRPRHWDIPLTSIVGLKESARGFKDLMTAPYQRIIIMHVTILLGGAISMALQQPKAAVVLLVVLKTAVDLGLHVRKNTRTGSEMRNEE